MRWTTFVLYLCWTVTGQAHAALQFDFDYRYDLLGFFDDPSRRDALEAAGRLINWYVDDLEAIVPDGTNGWSSFFSLPDGSKAIILKDLPVPADTMQIFVAGRPLPGRLAIANDTAPLGLPSVQDGGDGDWVYTVAHRGQTGAADDPATDFGPMGGAISFNNDPAEIQWHFNLSTQELQAHEFDFITVAMHELMHLLGFGTSVSFSDHTNRANEFVGPESVRVGSEAGVILELDDHGDHWDWDLKSIWNGNPQNVIVSPGVFAGQRAYPTQLDRAALIDIGWEPASAGDANRDRTFDSGDLVEVISRGLYETGQLAGWSDGDWNDNALFQSDDLVAALATGTFVRDSDFVFSSNTDSVDDRIVTIQTDNGLTLSAGPADGLEIGVHDLLVPEPSTPFMLTLTLLPVIIARRRRNGCSISGPGETSSESEQPVG